MPALRLPLPFRAPYDWRELASFLAQRAIPGVEDATPERYRRTVAVGGRQGIVTVRPDGEARLSAVLDGIDAGHEGEIAARLRRLFDLDADPAAIAARLGADPRLSRHVRTRPGLRVPGAWDGFELAVRAILGQQVSVAAARRLAGKLVAAFGERLAARHAAPGLSHLFPTPERLAEADIAAALGMPRARGAAIAGLARAAIADPGLFAPGEAAIARLRLLPGIGEWTAQYIAMRALRDADAFPAADIGVRRALAVNGARPSAAEAIIAAEAWRPWRAYAVLHLWTAEASGEALGAVEDLAR